MVFSKAEVLKLLEANKAKLTALGVRKFRLFGSFLYDQVSDKSDVDLLVEFDPDQKTFTNFSNLVFFLEALLGRNVEIVTKEGLSPCIGPHILRETEDVTISS